MELRNINTFLHIAELHSFSSAARELGYSQSAVSAQISQLEAELGTPLFDRVGKTVRLTDAGQTFQSYARTLLITAQQAKAALLPARAVSGTLRVALADSVCSTFLPDLLQQFHALCPQVELVLRTATADEMLRLLSANQIDLAYTLDQPLLLPSLTLAVNVPEPVCFVAPADHPLADRAEVPLDVLAQQEFLLTERGMSYRDALDQRLAALPDGGARDGALLPARVHRPSCPLRRAYRPPPCPRLHCHHAPAAVLSQGQMAHAPDESLY